MRGKKKCSECGLETGPRTLKCKGCDTSFHVNRSTTKRKTRKIKRETEIDWTKLEKDDIIKVVSGTGPYWGKGEEREGMGYYGTFTVEALLNDGIKCYAADKRNSGFCFVYMGEERTMETGTVLQAHKVLKVNKDLIHRRS